MRVCARSNVNHSRVPPLRFGQKPLSRAVTSGWLIASRRSPAGEATSLPRSVERQRAGSLSGQNKDARLCFRSSSAFRHVAGKRTKLMLSPIIRFIRNWRRYGRDVQELSHWSDRELADIGITRCDIRRIARGQSR
jgi:uncharacterized protein YjiS (DUF1127 family)